MAYEKDDGSNENLLESSSDTSEWMPRKQRSWRPWIWTALNVLLFFISLTLFATGYFAKNFISELELQRRCSFYSPVFDTIDLRIETKKTEGGLFETKHQPTIYRNGVEPNKTVDDAWEALEFIRVFPITSDQVRKLGKDPEWAVKFPPEYGLGDDAYMGQIDMFHQLHCLNLLRHLAWSEYDRNGTAKRPYSELHWVHVSHCTDILTQGLMCQGNLDVITYNWSEMDEKPFPDFDLNRKCRNFDDIVAWQEEHSVPLLWGRNVTRPAVYKELPAAKDAARILAGAPKETEVDPHDHVRIRY